MSTNAAIGVVIKGKIKAIYTHGDGGVESMGRTLVANYDQAKAELLVAEGDLSSLGSQVGVKHPFETYNLPAAEKAKYEGMTTFYRRDRGESDCRAKTFNTAEEFVEWYHGEY